MYDIRTGKFEIVNPKLHAKVQQFFCQSYKNAILAENMFFDEKNVYLQNVCRGI